MKPKTEMSYLERIDRVVGYLSDQVDHHPSLETLAEVAAISPFHFHRVYRAVTGETPSMTLRRMRLAKACSLLKDTNNSVTEIAFAVGYDSSQSFAKAFRAGTGYSPSEVRSSVKTIESVLNLLSRPASSPKSSLANIEVRITEVEPITVIASRHLGRHEGLFQTYGEFFAFAEKAGWVESFRNIYGIPIDDPRDTPEAQCRFDCCFEFGPEVKASGTYSEKHLGGGLYAVHRHLGHYDNLDDKYDYLYGPWLETSGYTLREVPFYNHYVQDPDTVPPEEWETDIYLPIENRF